MSLRKYDDEGLFVIETYVPGKTYKVIFEDTGLLPLESKERAYADAILDKACYSLGKGIGEVHTKGLEYQLVPSSHQISEDILELEDTIASLNATLQKINPVLKIDKDSPPIQAIIRAYQSQPGHIAHILGDVHTSNFTYSKKYRSVGFVDMESLTWNLDLSMRPTGCPSLEYAGMLKRLWYAGLEADLTQREIENKIKNFKSGYDSICELPTALHANRFFELDATIDGVRGSVNDMIEKRRIDIAKVTQLLDLLKDHIQSSHLK